MEKLIMVKYAELTTKKDNRNYFIRQLEENIMNVIKEYKPTIRKDYFRMFIVLEEDTINEVLNKLTKIFGIHEVVECYYSSNTSLDNIYELSKNVIKPNTSFKVVTNRSDKSYSINSMELSKLVGSYLLKNIENLKVILKNSWQS